MEAVWHALIGLAAVVLPLAAVYVLVEREVQRRARIKQAGRENGAIGKKKL
jgi:hypothetical protein